MHNYDLLFDVVLKLEFLTIYVDISRLNDFLVENTLSYVYNIDFSALRRGCLNNICKLVYKLVCKLEVLVFIF